MVLNVYATQATPNRCTLWCKLAHSLPMDYRWVLCGNLNVIESTYDKSSLELRIIIDKERHELVTLKATPSIEDFFSYNQPIIFSWDNKRLGEGRVMARLDRFYIFSSNSGSSNNHFKNYCTDGTWGSRIISKFATS